MTQRSYPLSPLQEACWRAFEVDPDSREWNRGLALRIASRVDASILREAYRRVVERHEGLRYVVDDSGPKPMQRPTGALPDLEVVDARSFSDVELVAKAQAILDAPFDLRRGPVIRLALLDRAESGAVLVLVNPHAFADLGGVDVFLFELGGFYREAVEGVPFSPPEPGSFGEEVERYLDGLAKSQSSDESFWRGELEGASSSLLAVGQRGRGAARRGRLVRHLLSSEEMKRLGAFKRSSGASTFRILVAAWTVLLARRGQQRDLLVGMNVRTATRAADHSIGTYVNTLPLRVKLTEDTTFGDVVGAVTKGVESLQAHRNFPAEHLSRLGSSEQGSQPTFKTVVALGRMHLCPDLSPAFLGSLGIPWTGKLGPLVVEGALPLDQHASRLDLELLMVEVGGGIGAELAFDENVLAPEAAERMLDGLARVLLHGITDPSMPVGAIDIIGSAERTRLEEWSRSPREWPDRATTKELFEAQAQRTPGAIAIEYGDEAISYRELDVRANRIAHRLREAGVVRESRVLVALGRSPRVPTAFLGVWKAGGAYVPVDPTYPSSRVSAMIEDAHPVLAIVDDSTAGWELGAVPKLHVDALLGAGDAGSNEPLGGLASNDGSALAYVIFTSGTTGRPKGVLVEHKGVQNYVRDLIERWQIGPGDRSLSFAPFSFDTSVADVYGALCSGATLVIRPDSTKGGGELRSLLASKSVSHAALPPAVWSTLDQPDSLSALRVCVTCGDAASSAFVENWGRGRVLLNEYGPTEITVCATSQTLSAGRAITIGRAISNVELYVLDEQRRPLPLGARGELYLSGVGLARGYESRADLTKDRFVDAAPFGAPKRLYRTGDLVQWTEEGELQFHGRADEQVKIRGFRVELGEIEEALRRIPGIVEAAVHAPEHDGRKVLVGCYAAGASFALSNADLRGELSRVLPGFMVPSHLHRIEKVPLGPHGKVDRTALPGVPREVVEEDEQATSLVDRVLRAFRQTLGNGELSAEDSFFDFGGDSLLAIELVTLLAQELKRDVSVIQVFDTPSARELCEAIGGDEPARVAPAAVHGGLLLFPPMDAPGAVYSDLVRELAPDPVEIAASLGEAALEDLVAKECALVEARGAGAVLVGWSEGGKLAFAVAARLAERGRPVAGVVLIDVHGHDVAHGASALARIASDVGALGPRIQAEADHEAIALAIEARPPAERLEAAFEELRRRDALPSGFSLASLSSWSESRAASKARSRALDALWEKVEGRPATVYIRAESSPDATVTALSDRASIVEVLSTSGDHFSVLTRHAAETSRAVRRAAQILRDRA